MLVVREDTVMTFVPLELTMRVGWGNREGYRWDDKRALVSLCYLISGVVGE